MQAFYCFVASHLILQFLVLMRDSSYRDSSSQLVLLNLTFYLLFLYSYLLSLQNFRFLNNSTYFSYAAAQFRSLEINYLLTSEIFVSLFLWEILFILHLLRSFLIYSLIKVDGVAKASISTHTDFNKNKWTYILRIMFPFLDPSLFTPPSYPAMFDDPILKWESVPAAVPLVALDAPLLATEARAASAFALVPDSLSYPLLVVMLGWYFAYWFWVLAKIEFSSAFYSRNP